MSLSGMVRENGAASRVGFEEKGEQLTAGGRSRGRRAALKHHLKPFVIWFSCGRRTIIGVALLESSVVCPSVLPADPLFLCGAPRRIRLLSRYETARQVSPIREKP
jgi:hypothetical protein